jgi:CDP-alcohol phosphatidyltransferase-like enzyme
MTVAVVLVSHPTEDWAVLRRLLDQLAALKVADVRVLTRPRDAPALRKLPDGLLEARLTESADPVEDLRTIAGWAWDLTEPMLILPAETVASGELLDRLAGTRKDQAVAVTHPENGGPPVRVAGRRVASAGTGFHQVTEPNSAFCGVLRVGPERRRTLAKAAERMAGLLETPGALPELTDVPSMLLVGLVRSGVRVTALRGSPLLCLQAHDPQQIRAALAAVEAVDEDRVRLNDAVKSNDGFFTTFAVSTYSRYIARWAARRGLTPNQVTSISMTIAVLAALCFATGSRLAMVGGAVLYYFAFVFDCVDGQLARYTRQFSTFGAWLDATFDRAKEYTVFAGLAVGSTVAAESSSVHAGNVWALAVAAMTLQTCRHMIDFSYGAARRPPNAQPKPLPVIPLTTPDDGRGTETAQAEQVEDGQGEQPEQPEQPVGPVGPRQRIRAALAAFNRLTKRGPARWAKKIIVFPIGERFALVCLTAALFNARVTFLALLAWGALAAFYTLTGRVLRSLSQ